MSPGIMSTSREEIHRHSGWWIPAAFLAALLLLAGLILGWDLRPGPKSPVASTGALVRLSLGDVSFAVPANYIENPKARSGGALHSLVLIARFPVWDGYSPSQARLFSSNAPDSPLVRISLRGDANSLTARDRLDRIYGPHIAVRAQAAFGLIRYGFVPGSDYGGAEMFAGEKGSDLFLFLCERASPQFPSPNCSSVDRPMGPGLNYSYRFKRAYLGRWQEIAAGVYQLIASFKKGA